MTMLTETRERFLLAITAQVPPERIAEIHFFQPIRQGGVESGVAVVAALPPNAAVTVEPSVEIAAEASVEDTVEASVEDTVEASVEDTVEASVEDTVEASVEPTVEASIEDTAEASVVDNIEPSVEGAVEGSAEAAIEPSVEDAVEPGAEVTAEEPAVERPVERPVRLVVYTARYRQTLKGLDRGKWEASVVAEADAPLVTVDAVVRGVQRRAGDLDDATRMDGDEIRAAIARRPVAKATAAR